MSQFDFFEQRLSFYREIALNNLLDVCRPASQNDTFTIFYRNILDGLAKGCGLLCVSLPASLWWSYPERYSFGRCH
jgi:hypothetical protein